MTAGSREGGARCRPLPPAHAPARSDAPEAARSSRCAPPRAPRGCACTRCGAWGGATGLLAAHTRENLPKLFGISLRTFKIAKIFWAPPRTHKSY